MGVTLSRQKHYTNQCFSELVVIFKCKELWQH